MYVEKIPNRNSPPAVLLREAWREGKKIRKRTIANLTRWPDEKVEALRRLLKGESLSSPREMFVVERTLPHGHVEAVLGTIRKLGLDRMLSAKRSRERDLVVAMIAERLLHPASKLATTRLWHATTLSEELCVTEADEDELYEALDWLLARQEGIERKLSARHLREGGQALYDVSSSYYEGRTCPLARFGHDRDGKGDHPIVVYGVMTNAQGCPVALEAYPGDTGDPSTVPDAVERLRTRFGLSHVVLVGDRGMLTKTQIGALRQHPGLGFLSALRSSEIRKLAEGGALQLSLFDERNLAEIASPLFPGERLIACFNPLLAKERARKREELLAATETDLHRIEKGVARRTKTPVSAQEIALRVGRLVHRRKVAKHFDLGIGEGSFSFARNEESIRREAALDGIYVIRTSEPAERLCAEDAVRGYKNLGRVEQAFRTLKGIGLLVRPIHHRAADRVRAHLFLCPLASSVEWHIRRWLATLLFVDQTLP